MYSTCLFCDGALGRNEVVEHFPVGRRLAFDAAKGRLWVVCRTCERWNLTPLDERWEAIEECERLFEGVRVRAATENVGLAKLREGLELVRIGAPMRPEFAAWRYGDQFRRRRRIYLWTAGAVGLGLGAIALEGVVTGVGVAAFSGLFQQAYNALVHGRPNAVVRRVALPPGDVAAVRRRHLADAAFGVDERGELELLLRHDRGETMLSGRRAASTLALLLPAANKHGGDLLTVAGAVREIEQATSVETFVVSMARSAMAARKVSRSPVQWRLGGTPPLSGLYVLGDRHRLALEMALHEESERRAMEGELAELEAEWRNAEEIAAIADNLA